LTHTIVYKHAVGFGKFEPVYTTTEHVNEKYLWKGRPQKILTLKRGALEEDFHLSLGSYTGLASQLRIA
jgi:hypothetical protein